MKIALIVNPFSGNKCARKLLPTVERELSANNIQTEVFISRYKDHIFEIVKNLDINRYDAIAAMGGDGTNFHMINGLLSVHPPDRLPALAILPAGSGNSFVRDLGITSLEAGIRAIIRNRPRQVDVISFTWDRDLFYFVNLMGFGFVTDVALTAEKFKAFHDLSYLIGIIYRTFSLGVHHMELTIDGQIYSGPNCFVEFCNSGYTGGNMHMAPRARIDDGLMDVVITGPLTRKRLLGALPKIYAGTHLDMEEIIYVQGKRAEIRTIPAKAMLPDGEILGQTPGVIEVHPKQLRYVS